MVEFAAGVKVGENQFHRRHFPLGMNIDGDAAAIVPDGNGAIDVNGNVNVLAIAGQMFVDGVVEHLEDTMVQPPFIRVAYVHPRAFADGFQTL